MANQEQIPQQQHQDEPQDQGTPIHSDPALQVEFEPNMIHFKDNNKIALIYPEHSNKNYFLTVLDFIFIFCLMEAFTSSTTIYKEYLVDFWYTAKVQVSQRVWFLTPTRVTHGEVGLTSFRNVVGANYLAHSRDYAQTPSIEDVRAWFPSIRYGEEIKTKGTLKKALLPPRYRLLMAQIIQCLKGKIDEIISKLKKKNKEKVIPYPIFLSLLLELKMKGYGTDNFTSIPTQIFNVNNLILKKGQSKGPLFIDHMLAIHKADKPVAFKAPKTSSHTEKKDSQGKKPEAKSGHKKKSSSKYPSMSSIEDTKGGSSKAPTGSKTGHSKRKKESSSTMDSNPRQPLISILVDHGMHKEDQQPTGDPTSLEVTNNDRANPQLNSEDLVKLVKNVKADFMDLDSPEDDPIIVVDESEGDDEVDKDKGIYSTSNVKTKDALASKPSSPRNSLPTELKELLTKFNELAKDVKGLKNQWELPAEFLPLPIQVASVQAKLKTLDAFLSLLQKVTEALDRFAQVFNTVSKKAGDTSIPSAGQAGTIPAEGEKNTNQEKISQLFQRRADKYSKNNNMNKQPESITPLAIPIISPIIPTTTHRQSPFLQSPPKNSSQPKREQTKEDKGKKATPSKNNKEESTECDYDDENTSHVAGSLAESSKKKK
nr:hypothetical protein [Tanacetum cinerariifolium]